jgi:hypothetical protein
MPDADWTPHRRDDGELLGWIRPEGADWVAVDVLGRSVSEAIDWLDAEASLEAHGLAWLADAWMLEQPGGLPLRVRIVEVTPSDAARVGRIMVKEDDFGDMSRPASAHLALPWPIPSSLRQPRAGDPDPNVF